MGNFFDNIGNAFNEIGKNVSKATGDVVNNVGKAAGDVGNNISRAAGEAGRNINNFAGDVGRNVSSAAENVSHNVGAFASQVGENVSKTAGDINRNIQGAFEKKPSKMEEARTEAQHALDKVNKQIVELGERDARLFDNLNEIQACFDAIRNIPAEQRLQYEELKKIRLEWKQRAQKIEDDYKKATLKNAGAGTAGVGVGVAFAALAPTAAMGIATTFGVASTGTAISALSGAAATNAALAWLGGGALAAGGGGMAAGNAFLAMCGPIGWAIAGVALLGSGFLLYKGNEEKKKLENVFALIGKRDTKSYNLAETELKERIVRIDDENPRLGEAIARTKSFGLDYNQMTEAQQYELGSYVNLMNASTQLLVNPILGLQPKVTPEDLTEFGLSTGKHFDKKHGEAIVSLANLLYKIDVDGTDRRLLGNAFSKNRDFLQSVHLDKKDFDPSVLTTVNELLLWKYGKDAAGKR